MLPDYWVYLIFPLSFDELDKNGADDNDDRTKSISKHMQKHVSHVQLRSRLCNIK